ncbi:MAG: preprotein translocase subunit YajC [Nitrospirales bacterium]|nr:preprotein translocase subunit YajC [Nitrospira sp.]MDR4500109.1 preprotein translocase subunit YajC [Nitrospirales bacterium]
MNAIAWAQTAGGGSPQAGLLSFVPFILIFVVFYFLLILPQQRRQKKQRELLAALKKGDKVITSAGIWGTITNLDKDTVTLQIADNTKIRLQRDYVGRLRETEENS